MKKIILIFSFLIPLFSLAQQGGHDQYFNTSDTFFVDSTDIKIYRDASDNLVVEDGITGAKTLAELSAGGGGGGLTFDFDLAENMTAGDVAILESDGDIVGAGEITLNNEIADISSYSKYASNSSLTGISVPSNTSQSTILNVWSSGTQDTIYARLGTIAVDKSITFGVSSYILTEDQDIDCAVNAVGGDEYWFLVFENTPAGYGAACTITPDGSGGVTFGTETVYNSNLSHSHARVINIDDGRFAVAEDDGASELFLFSANSTGTISELDAQIGGLDECHNLTYSESLGRIFIAGWDATSDASIEPFSITGNVLALAGARDSYSTNDADWSDIEMISNDSVLVVFTDNSNSDTPSSVLGFYNSGTDEFNWETPVSFNIGDYHPISDRIGCLADSINKKAVFVYCTDQYDSLRIVHLDYGSQSLTVDSITNIFYNNQIYPLYDIKRFPESPKWIVSGIDYSNNLEYIIQGNFDGVESNITATNYIGILQESGTTGQTKTVSLLGGVDSNQSGLTIGEVYYLQSDGSLSTTQRVGYEFGRAISTTTILMKGL